MKIILTPRQWKVLWALLESPTYNSAAKRAGVSIRTVKRYLANDQFRKVVNSFAIRIGFQQMVFRLQDLKKNTIVLRELREDKSLPPSIRLQAIQHLESSFASNLASDQIETRLSDLEDLVDELSND